MNLIEYLDRAGQRRLERWRIAPPRPRDTRMLVGTLFFAGYYGLVYFLINRVVPAENGPLVRDAVLVLGPVVGAIGSALFRSDVKDEIATSNTGTAFRALGKQADATIAAAAATPPDTAGAALGAERVAEAAVEEAEDVRAHAPHLGGSGNVAD